MPARRRRAEVAAPARPVLRPDAPNVPDDRLVFAFVQALRAGLRARPQSEASIRF